MGGLERAKEVITQCPEVVRPKVDYTPIILPRYLIPDFLYLGWSCFCSKIIDVNIPFPPRLFPGVVRVLTQTRLGP